MAGPEDDDTRMHINLGMGGWNSITMEELIDRAKTKWGDDLDFSKIAITSEHVHMRCLTYDLYDSSDYDEIITLELKG